jgi:exodeoxyribonuclease III
MRLVTWNVNSLRVRLERIEAWLLEVSPDVVCMQETKLADDAFPALMFESLGYQTAH